MLLSSYFRGFHTFFSGYFLTILQYLVYVSGAGDGRYSIETLTNKTGLLDSDGLSNCICLIPSRRRLAKLK